jgi:hypothetical protein
MPRAFPPALRSTLLAILAALLVAACGGEDGEETTAANLPEGCEQADAPPPSGSI